MLGVGVLVGAKVVGTALLARIYALTRPQLLSIGWFARLHARVVTFKERVHEIVRASAIYRAVRERALRLRALARELLGPRDGVSWRRRWAAALRLSRRRARP